MLGSAIHRRCQRIRQCATGREVRKNWTGENWHPNWVAHVRASMPVPASPCCEDFSRSRTQTLRGHGLNYGRLISMLSWNSSLKKAAHAGAGREETKSDEVNFVNKRDLNLQNFSHNVHHHDKDVIIF